MGDTNVVTLDECFQCQLPIAGHHLLYVGCFPSVIQRKISEFIVEHFDVAFEWLTFIVKVDENKSTPERNLGSWQTELTGFEIWEIPTIRYMDELALQIPGKSMKRTPKSLNISTLTA